MVRIKSESFILPIQVICIQPLETVYPPEGFSCGIQDRRNVVHRGQQNADGAMVYHIQVSVAQDNQSQRGRFRGDYIHGTTQVPFLYLSVKQADTEQAIWIRRLKIPLPKIQWTNREAIANTQTLIARISGTGSGTVPLLDAGWLQRNNNTGEIQKLDSDQ